MMPPMPSEAIVRRVRSVAVVLVCSLSGLAPEAARSQAAQALPLPAADDAAETGFVREATGPWGTLQSYFVYVAAPEQIVQLYPLPSEVTTWNFPGLRSDEVAAVLNRRGIPEDIRAELLDKTRWTILEDTIQISPSAAAIVGLPAEDRAAIYEVLARWEVNEFHHSPWYVPANDEVRWLAGSGLRRELTDAVARTTYLRGRTRCFSDVSLLMGMTTSDGEAKSVVKALSRCRTAILRLKLDGRMPLGQLVDYWGAGTANAKDFLPLLESVSTNPQVNHLDVVHLLPPYPRKLLYTYPHPSLAIGGRYPDCHWTSLNFFNYRPEGRVFDTVGATMRVLEDYDAVPGPARFGDMFLLLDADGNAIHSCVHLADGYVFTKNGSTVISPWLVMQLDEVRDRYSQSGPPAVQIYRRRQ